MRGVSKGLLSCAAGMGLLAATAGVANAEYLAEHRGGTLPAQERPLRSSRLTGPVRGSWRQVLLSPSPGHLCHPIDPKTHPSLRFCLELGQSPSDRISFAIRVPRLRLTVVSKYRVFSEMFRKLH